MNEIEKYGWYFIIPGIILGALGQLWMIMAGFRTRRYWGLALLLLVPDLLFLFRHFRRALGPLLVMLLGAAVVGTPIAINRYQMLHLDLGERERTVNGELHLTLTGWDKKDYGFLAYRPRVVVLQMANPDVDDKVLENLKDMDQLRELDLSNTQVTDAGLALLARLPKLVDLKLENTAITDAGFREHLAPLDHLLTLNVRGTRVEKPSLAAWKAQNKERRCLPRP
jgi:hypothetical protein